jgi:hypothetical protein
LTLQTLIFLKTPQVAAAFALATTALDGHMGVLEGSDLERVARFLRVSGGAPQFDLLYDGQVFHRCRLADEASDASIRFVYESISAVENELAHT